MKVPRSSALSPSISTAAYSSTATPNSGWRSRSAFLRAAFPPRGKNGWRRRIAQINEIRAGAGNDLVDMTSQRFAYVGEGLTVRGGDGDDTIWATGFGNYLFGDAGDDRIVGADGMDFIAGGSGNDSMNGGGGRDVFTFGGNWGDDTVEQLDDDESMVMLWFAEGDHANWNASTLTYADGANSVTVKGVSADQIEIYIGDEFPWDFEMMNELGIFAESTSQNVFEDKNKGLLAAL